LHCPLPLLMDFLIKHTLIRFLGHCVPEFSFFSYFQRPHA
jgi:hypothetical protein